MTDGKPMEAELKWVSIADEKDGRGGFPIAPQPFPPRESGDVTELVSSVRLQGLFSPLLLRPLGAGFQVVCGYRRYLAARAAGLSTVPALILPLGDAEAIRCYLSEKVTRKPLAASSRREVLETLRRLRDGRQGTTPAAVPAAEKAIAASRSQQRSPGSLQSPGARLASDRVRALGIEVEGETAAQAQPFLASSRLRLERVEAPGWEIGEETEALLREVLATRSIAAERVERIVEEIIGLTATVPPLDFLQLYRTERPSPTAPHSVLVAALCAAMARSLGWGEDETRRLVLGGFLHDAGMVFIDLGRFRSAGGLSTAQRASLPHHTRIGYALIHATRAWPEEVALSARDHHERWNGSGYPQGRVGTEVCLDARILTYLDTFAALISPRPHRDALEPRSALQRLTSASELGLLAPGLLRDVLEVLDQLPAPVAARTEEELCAVPAENSIELMRQPVTMREEGSR